MKNKFKNIFIILGVVTLMIGVSIQNSGGDLPPVEMTNSGRDLPPVEVPYSVDNHTI